ncbi:MAG: DNA-binding response regulator [Ignavibacteriae bacterium HGW-Ignavibacteriae-2]|jgi:DNA-binding NarL/FixJ family response regulator|nr:response regulator transcription factor [Bacteroidota bacterium]PKL90435.1 MAG: DNA-binding response regulator [Ignavibacteriae bacterium HGW-Ignavibacteriae-2]
MIKVAIVEDNEMIREGLKILIDGTEGYECVAAYPDCESLLRKIDKIDPNVILMDIDLPGMSGLEGIRQLREKSEDYNILVLTIYDENEVIFEALCSGACGYLVKKTPPARLLEAIKEANEGGAPMNTHIARKVVNLFRQTKEIIPHEEPASLTPREKEVLLGLVEGNSYKAIADTLFISVETVRFHFRNIYKKLHVHSQSEAVVKAIKEGLV